MAINVTVSGGTGIDAAPQTSVEVQGGIGPAAFVNHLGEVVGVNPIVAGSGITITTASGSLTISGLSSDVVSNLAPVQSVAGRTGDVVLTLQDVTAAAAVHTHSTTDVAGLTATIQQYGKVLSVNGYDGDVTLTVQDLTAAEAVHTHTSAEITDLTATIQQYGNVTSVNNYTGNVTLTLAALTDVSNAAPANGQALVWSGSEWAGGNIPPGTTVNGLSGDLTLAAGDGVTIANSGSTITLNATANLSGYATEQFVLDRVGGSTPDSNTFAHGLQLVQTFDGLQHFSWAATDDYSQPFVVEIAELGQTQNISQAGTFSPQSDGSLDLTVSMQTDTVGSVLVFASTTGQDADYEPIPFSEAVVTDGQVDIQGIYLSEAFSAAGSYNVLAAVLDVGGEEIGTLTTTRAFAQHGSPLPPAFLSNSAAGLSISANVETNQTPHMLGFYAPENITYFLEIAQQPDAQSWIRGAGVQAGSSPVTVSATATSGGTWYARVVATNPLGEGPPSEAIQVSGE